MRLKQSLIGCGAIFATMFVMFLCCGLAGLFLPSDPKPVAVHAPRPIQKPVEAPAVAPVEESPPRQVVAELPQPVTPPMPVDEVATVEEKAVPCIPIITEEFEAKVIGITDGDTIRTLTADKRTVVVRLEGIDAPEKGQEHGSKATDALKEMVVSRNVRIRVTGKDKYGRTLGFVDVNGSEINQRLVEDGWAWHFKKYNCEDRLDVAEAKAREQRLGLWAHDRPIPPWEYRNLRERRLQTERADRQEMARQKEERAKAEKPEPAPVVTLTHWLNSSSGVRHNSGCRHYQNTKSGRMCGPDEGRACGICGG